MRSHFNIHSYSRGLDNCLVVSERTLKPAIIGHGSFGVQRSVWHEHTSIIDIRAYANFKFRGTLQCNAGPMKWKLVRIRFMCCDELSLMRFLVYEREVSDVGSTGQKPSSGASESASCYLFPRRGLFQCFLHHQAPSSCCMTSIGRRPLFQTSQFCLSALSFPVQMRP